jgi:hypothetical protein
MDKFIILACLIYVASCLNGCSTTLNPTNAEQCFDARPNDEENYNCCFIQAPSDLGGATVCIEIPKTVEDFVEYFKKNFPAYKNYNVKCSSGFSFGNILKSILLVASLILI